MNILAIDSSTTTLSIALIINGKRSLIFQDVGLKHGESLLPQVDRLLKDSQVDGKSIDLIACAKGPGSFTGLRIGMSTAKGLAEGWQVPLVSVYTPDILAWGKEYFDGIVVPVVDGRKKQVYTALYRKGERISEYLDISIEQLTELIPDNERVLFTGPDIHLAESIKHPCDVYFDKIRTGADAMAALAERQFQEKGADGPGEGPFYLRKSEAEIHFKG